MTLTYRYLVTIFHNHTYKLIAMGQHNPNLTKNIKI